ncbi:MAG TPA: class I SAM-dependent methyltransferase [Candidatus Saccharimonadales bacterium]|nr:class I SAM-dependent methyltransferase [Candidatus Saccharimonadales bacterium]
MIKYQGLSTLEILEVAKNYNKWIAEQCLQHIKSPLLEVGSGTGNISKFFLSKKGVTLSDIDAGLVKTLKKKFSQKSVSIQKIDISKKLTKRNKYQTIVAINVLEHIQDDKKAIKNMHALLQKGGKIILLVPAKKFAYTEFDRLLGHHRRYEKEKLKKLTEKSGFITEKIYYFNFVGLWSWILRSKMEKSHSLKPYQVAIFDKIVPYLKVIEKVIPVPVGVSLILVGVKK